MPFKKAVRYNEHLPMVFIKEFAQRDYFSTFTTAKSNYY